MKISVVKYLRVILCFAVLNSYANYAWANKGDDNAVKYLELYGSVIEKIKEGYVEEVSYKDLVEASINGMLSSLDPHSSYLNEKSFGEMKIQTKGEFGGLGIEVTMENGLVKVVAPIDDTPAYRVGIESGDYISHIDDEPVMGLTLNDAVDKMRGRPGTKIDLEVIREGENKPLSFTVKRAIIEIKSVKSEVKGDNIGYFRIRSFSEQTARSLRNEIKKIKKKLDDDLLGVVIDMRNNPGGLLDQAIEVSDLFLDRGEVVSTGGRLNDSNHRFNATSGDLLDGKPIVVLINGGSASASEIVAGALQDHKRAVIMGVKSFGKGSVQTVMPLSTSQGAMRLTTSRYFTPSGRSIQAEGIEPDVIVEQAKIEPLKNGKRSSESSLRGHLKNGDKKKVKASEKKEKDGKSDDSEDYQLMRAMDLLKGIAIYKK